MMNLRELYRCSCGTRAELIWNEDRTTLLGIYHQGLHTVAGKPCQGPMELL